VIDTDGVVGLAVYAKKTVKAHEIIGSALDPNAKLTDKVLTVATLLDPLSRDQGLTKHVACLHTEPAY